jgi:osmoprotectant transport system ATP-binding protein
VTAISYTGVSKKYGQAGAPAVHDVTLDVEAADFAVLIGPSGCGKTTLLKMTNRLIDATAGSIVIDGRDIRSVKLTELRRHMGYVIQQVGLFPHYTVAANVATVPRLLAWPKKKIEARTDELLDLVGLEPDRFRQRYPHQLSGGQQQRVGLARALAADPDILLMDEPFGAIDAITRTRLQDQLLTIQRAVRKTVLFVTHDVDEALRLADKLIVMRDGNVLQYASPLEVLTKPADDFVSELLNTDDVLRELGVVYIKSVMSPASTRQGPPIIQNRSLREALSMMLATRSERLTVIDDRDDVVGTISMSDVERLSARDRQPVGAAQ